MGRRERTRIRASVLVVEDDPDTREALASALERTGYAVTRCPDGRAAVERLMAATELPRLIVLDWFLPKMNGADFVAWQAASPRLCDIPVLVLSAAEGAVPFSDTVVAVVPKPTRLSTVVGIVDRLCGVTRHDRRLEALGAVRVGARLATAQTRADEHHTRPGIRRRPR
jgi:CheY-like chemotaxis protein